jgi:hypothetical protein
MEVIFFYFSSLLITMLISRVDSPFGDIWILSFLPCWLWGSFYTDGSVENYF